MSCSQKNNHLKIINAECACDTVNALFQSRLSDSKSTKDNWCRVCCCCPHFGDFNFQVFTLGAFLEYLNDFISVGWDCHFYNRTCRIVISGLLANIFSVSMNWRIPQKQLDICSLRQSLVRVRTICRHFSIVLML